MQTSEDDWPVQFKVGDVVALKSGSKRMTVVAVHAVVQTVSVVWQVYETSCNERDTLPFACLRHWTFTK